MSLQSPSETKLTAVKSSNLLPPRHLIAYMAAAFVMSVYSIFWFDFDATTGLQGEIISSLGQREVRSLIPAPVLEVLVKQGDSVKEQETIAVLLFDKRVEGQMRDAVGKLKEFVQEIPAVDASDLKLLVPEMNFTEVGHPNFVKELDQHKLKISGLVEEISALQDTRKRLLASEAATLNLRILKIAEKIESYKAIKSSQFSRAKIDDLRAERERIKLQIASILEPVNSKINEQKAALELTTKSLTTMIEGLLRDHQIRSPISGVISQLRIQASSEVAAHQLLALVAPNNNQQQLLIPLQSSTSDPSLRPGLANELQRELFKLAEGRALYFRLFDSNGKNLGSYSGKQPALEQTTLKIKDADVETSRLRISLTAERVSDRKPSSETLLQDGQKVKVLLLNQKKNLLHLWLESHFAP